MARHWTADQALVEHREAVEEMASQERIALARNRGELEVQKLKVKAVEARKVRERVLVGLVKLPVVGLAICGIVVLTLCNREVPQQLSDFITF